MKSVCFSSAPPDSMPSSASRTLPVSVHSCCVNLADTLKGEGRVSINILLLLLPPFQRCYCSHELILSNNSSAERYVQFTAGETDLGGFTCDWLVQLFSLPPFFPPWSQTLSPFPPQVISLARLPTAEMREAVLRSTDQLLFFFCLFVYIFSVRLMQRNDDLTQHSV